MTGIDNRQPSMKQRMLAGELYRFEGEELAADAARATDLTWRINTTRPADEAQLKELYRELLGGFGEESFIRPPVQFDYGYQTTIGAGTFANFGLVVLDVAKVTIGDNVQMGPNVQLLTPTHPLEPEARRAGWEAAEPITIGNNVWLGGGVIVCPGVTIGDDSVIGAGSVVTKDIPSGVIAVGNPAKVIRSVPRDS